MPSVPSLSPEKSLSPLDNASNSIVFQHPIDPIHVTVRTLSATYSPGQRIDIEIDVQNDSRHDIDIDKIKLKKVSNIFSEPIYEHFDRRNCVLVLQRNNRIGIGGETVCKIKESKHVIRGTSKRHGYSMQVPATPPSAHDLHYVLNVSVF